MWSLFGSRDQAALERVCAELEDVFGEGEAPIATRIATRAILQGVPFEGLEAETEEHIFAADTLARHNQSPLDTDADIWRIEAFIDLLDSLGAYLDPQAHELLSYLCDGRPLFAQVIHSYSMYYAYLSLEEVKALRAALVRLQEAQPERVEHYFPDGFLNELVRWLTEIAAQDLDLWLFAS